MTASLQEKAKLRKDGDQRSKRTNEHYSTWIEAEVQISQASQKWCKNKERNRYLDVQFKAAAPVGLYCYTKASDNEEEPHGAQSKQPEHRRSSEKTDQTQVSRQRGR